MEYVKVEKRETGDGLAAILTIDKPPANALNQELIDELYAKFLSIDAAGVIITGTEKVFVAGADIAQMSKLSPIEAEQFSIKGNKLMSLIESYPHPVIAAVNGYALGGGLELALSCDIIIGSKKAVFGFPEVTLGLIPGFGGTQRLMRLIGKGYAKELIFTGKRINAEQAGEIGLINSIADDALETSVGIVRDICKASRNAVSVAKRTMADGAELSNQDALKLEAARFGLTFSHKDAAEGMSAFLEKRAAGFEK